MLTCGGPGLVCEQKEIEVARVDGAYYLLWDDAYLGSAPSPYTMMPPTAAAARLKRRPTLGAPSSMRTVRCYRRRWWHRSALPRPLRAADAPPLIVLVNRRSASAAEVLAAALAHSGRAVLVGKRTFGKGVSQALVYQRDVCRILLQLDPSLGRSEFACCYASSA